MLMDGVRLRRRGGDMWCMVCEREDGKDEVMDGKLNILSPEFLSLSGKTWADVSRYAIPEKVLNSGSKSEMGAKVEAGRVLSLLFVEDDTLVCEITGNMIAKKFPDITVYTAFNGRIGVELFKEHVPDIVITDINMPDMDGFQMANEIKRLKADTRFILVTGYSDNQYLNKFSEIGINNHIAKPVIFGNLFEMIEKCINEINLQQR
jgi:CheY-like chemotaxis protein